MSYVCIKGINKTHLLWLLLVKSESPVFSDGSSPPISAVDAFNEAETKNWKFGYLQGRVMKCDISGNSVCTQDYDDHNGKGTFQECVNIVRDISL